VIAFSTPASIARRHDRTVERTSDNVVVDPFRNRHPKHLRC
jgi:hypothetical protein